MRWLIALGIAAAACCTNGTVMAGSFLQKACACPLNCLSKLDLVLVLQASGSVDDLGFAQQKKFAFDMITPMTNVGQSRLGVVTFAEEANIAAGMSGDRAELERQVGVMTRPAGYSSMLTEALGKVSWLLMSGGRQDAQSVVVIVLAAPPMNGIFVKQLLDDMKQTARVVIVSIGYQNDLPEFKTWASTPGEANTLAYTSFQGLDPVKMIPELCPQVGQR